MDAFKKFYPSLQEILPVDVLATQFFSKNLLSNAHKEKLDDLSKARVANKEKAKFFLDEVIAPGLRIGYMQQFDQMLLIMSNSDEPPVKFLASEITKSRSTDVTPKGVLSEDIQGDDTEQFQPAAKKQRSDQDSKAYDYADDISEEVDFTKHGNNVNQAFIQLLGIFRREAASLHFRRIRTACIASASGKLESAIREVQNRNDLFDLLACSKLHCNCIRITILEAIADFTNSKKLEGILKKYRDAFFSKTLTELWDNLPHNPVRSTYYKDLKATFNDKDPEKLTVQEFKEYCASQETTDLDDFIKEIRRKCLSVTWLVPTDKVYKLFLSALIVPQESRQDDCLEIGAWVVYHPLSVLEKLKIDFGMASPSTLLIGYYHGVLVRDINADSLADDMCSEKLLSSCDRNLISIAHSVYHRNWLILEYVKHVDTNIFLAFCKLVSKSWPGIGLQLCTVSATTFQPEDQDLNVDSADFMEAQAMLLAQYSYYKSPLVHVAFLCVIDQVREQLRFCDITRFIKECENIMASEQENIKLFSSHMIVKLSKCSSVLTLLWCLSCFFTWCNHSILRHLLIKCKNEAVQLLDEFDSRFDPLQCIASYPIPYFSSDMIPDDSSEYTILTIRCDQELYKSTLQYVYDMQALIIEKCNITQHCLQLLAVRSNPTMLYWTIPKCVVKIISDQIPKHSEYLYTKGVLEVLVYPEPLLSMGDDVTLGTLAFIAESKSNDEEVTTFKEDDTAEYYKSYKALQQYTERLKADNTKLKTQLEDLEQISQLKDSCSNCKALQDKMTKIKLENKKLKEQLNLKLKNKVELVSQLVVKCISNVLF